MKSRDKILADVAKNQPEKSELPDISVVSGNKEDAIAEFMEVFKTIGGNVVEVNGIDDVKKMIAEQYDSSKRFVTTLPELVDIAEPVNTDADPHSFENAELAIIRAHFVVAENGASWLTEESMGQRIVPYICQHLAVLVNAGDVIPTLHEAYERIGAGDYGFGGFIGGPSKTADIEQALVLGAHGPLSMAVFILQTIGNNNNELTN